MHDCFLRNWRWDPNTACFAILMSPWFSRGWTALELANSPKVKVIFKGNRGPVIKDLDEEILAADYEPDGPRKAASRIIRSLRNDVTTLNDLLAVLGPRHTSWPKDMAIISALLVGVAPGELRQDTNSAILKKLGRISPGNLFHGAATSSKGFSWCPTNLFHMPLDSSSHTLIISDSGDIRGRWRTIPVDSSLESLCAWSGTHPLITLQLQEALGCSSARGLLLAECGCKPVRRALLVKALEDKIAPGSLRCQYIGTLHFRQDLTEEDSWCEKDVMILGDDQETVKQLTLAELSLRRNGEAGTAADEEHSPGVTGFSNTQAREEEEHPGDITSESEALRRAL